MSGGARVPASVRGCGLPDQQRRHGRGAADQGAAARQEGDQVSCGWWRAGHVTSTLTLIGPGGRGQRGAEPGQPPGPGPQPAPQEAHLRQQGGQRGHSQVRTLKHAAAEEARL